MHTLQLKCEPLVSRLANYPPTSFTESLLPSQLLSLVRGRSVGSPSLSFSATSKQLRLKNKMFVPLGQRPPFLFPHFHGYSTETYGHLHSVTLQGE